MTANLDLADRLRGLLIGTAIGDALGAPVEGRPHIPDQYMESIISARRTLP